LNQTSSPTPRYALALALLLASMVYVIAAPESEWQRLLSLVLQVAALHVTLSAAGMDRRLRLPFALLFGGAIAAGFVFELVGDSSGAGYIRTVILVLVAAVIPVVGFGVLRQVRQDVSITVHTMIGVLCVYLLMSIFFAYLFAVIGELGNSPFFSQGAQWNDLSDYLYFSLTTITTVGMGDLSPATDLGRSLTAAEALIGQIYMVTVVAVIVSNIGHKRSRSDG
jgi:hypothetical protein